jgi:hypothetical protein
MDVYRTPYDATSICQCMDDSFASRFGFISVSQWHKLTQEYD